MAADFYRCVADGESPIFFQKNACQLLADPTTPFQAAIQPAAQLPVPPITHPFLQPEVSAAVPVVVRKTRVPAGPWVVTQLLVPAEKVSDSQWKKQAVINNRRVGVGAVVAGGRVQEITRTYVIMTHSGGETLVPFGQETSVNTGLESWRQVSLQELGKDPSILLQRLAFGEEVLIVHKGEPLARLLPIPSAMTSEKQP